MADGSFELKSAKEVRHLSIQTMTNIHCIVPDIVPRCTSKATMPPSSSFGLFGRDSRIAKQAVYNRAYNLRNNRKVLVAYVDMRFNQPKSAQR